MLARHKPALIYLPISQGPGFLRDLLFLLPSRWLGISTVIHLRGSEFRAFYTNSSRNMQALIRYSLAHVRRVIVLGEGLRSLFEGLVPLDQVVIVPNGTPDFAVGLLPFDSPAGGVRGLFLSNLRIRKGLFVVLEAAIESLRRFPELEFVFAGEWESNVEREQAMAIAQDWLATNRLHFCGVVVGDEKHRLLLSCDFLVFPPIEPEGHPRVVLESMAAGLPIITTPQGAIVETVVEGETGFMVQPGNARAVAEKIAYLIEHPEIRQAMGRAARERFLKHYTAEASASRLANVFVQVLVEA